jgi:hypothetical protein
MSNAQSNSMDNPLSIKSWVQEDYIIKIAHQEQKSHKAAAILENKVSENEQGVRFLQQKILSETLKLDKSGNPIDFACKQIVDDNSANTGMVTFHLLPYVQLPFLQSLYNRAISGKAPKVIEIGASEGRLAYKMLLTGAKVVANDLYDNQLKLAQDFVNHNLQFRAKDFSTNKANVLDILKINPEYKSHFDYVYIQNVIHFFNPHQCLELFQTTWDLLNANGIAYITSQTYLGRAQHYIKGSSYSINSNQHIDTKNNEEEGLLSGKKILKHIFENLNQKKEFPSFIEIRNDKSGKLKFVKDADYNAKVGRADSNGGGISPYGGRNSKISC